MPECWSAHVICTGIKTNHKYLATIWNFAEILSDKFFFHSWVKALVHVELQLFLVKYKRQIFSSSWHGFVFGLPHKPV